MSRAFNGRRVPSGIKSNFLHHAKASERCSGVFAIANIWRNFRRNESADVVATEAFSSLLYSPEWFINSNRQRFA